MLKNMLTKTFLAAVLLCWSHSWIVAQDNVSGCQMRVETDPPDATVLYDGVSKGAAPVLLSNLRPGDHLVSATKQGYKEVRRTVSLSQGQPTIVKLTLERVLGLVLIHSEPPESDVQINGADRGKTPLLITDLPVGKYRVRVSRAGHLPKEIDLEVADRTPVKIMASLTSDSATCVLTSEPAGASVTLNGVSKGTTPCTIDQIPAGSVAIEVAMDGYVPYSQNLKLVAGQKEELKVILKVVPCELRVESIPPGGRIYVENQFRGEAPLTINDLAPGTYRIRAELKGYEPMARDVELKQAQKLVEEFRLARDCGMFEITTVPAEVTVLIDGQQVGATKPKTAEDDGVSDSLSIDLLSIGEHQVKLTKKGYFDSSFTIEIEKEKTTIRHETMKRNFVPDYEVRTFGNEVIQGVLVEISQAGSIKLEIRPRIFRTIDFKDVKSRRPLHKEPDKKLDQQ
jgi:hypothetical protein